MGEVENYRDPFAVAVVRSGVIIGHVSRKISSVCSMFLRRGGTISCRVTGGRRYSEDLPQGGLEVPCTLTHNYGCVYHGTVRSQGPRGSGSLVVSLDALK